jgi:ribosomal protein S12 methylthiotransferase accessory factor
MTITISFPGGVAVDATLNGHTVHTDQPAPLGRDLAMSPFDLFLASIGTCMGFYALRFCQQRDIATNGLRLTVNPLRDEEKKRVTTLRVLLQRPEAFPDKYCDAIRRGRALLRKATDSRTAGVRAVLGDCERRVTSAIVGLRYDDLQWLNSCPRHEEQWILRRQRQFSERSKGKASGMLFWEPWH